MSVGKLTGPKKAAILLLALGEDAAADVLKNLEEVEIQQVGYFMTRFTDIAPEEVDIVLEEFYRNSVTQEEGVNINASPDFVRNALNKAVGPDRAKELSDNLSATGEDSGLVGSSQRSADLLCKRSSCFFLFLRDIFIVQVCARILSCSRGW